VLLQQQRLMYQTDKFSKLKAKPFPEELFRMATRCMTDAHATGWSLPTAVHQAVYKHTTATTERVANPLDSHMDSERYWSPNMFGLRALASRPRPCC
jgi:hypothetical protein